jgi:hypothetical protein
MVPERLSLLFLIGDDVEVVPTNKGGGLLDGRRKTVSRHAALPLYRVTFFVKMHLPPNIFENIFIKVRANDPKQ